MTQEPINTPPNSSTTKPPLLSSFQATTQTIETIFNTYTQNTDDNNNDTSNNSSKKSSVNSSLISQQFHTQFGSVAETDDLIEATSSKHITTYSNLLSKIKRSPHRARPSVEQISSIVLSEWLISILRLHGILQI